MANTNRRKMTGARAGRSLSQFKVITVQGPTKAPMIGRGNPFVREDGTAIRIFNVALFPDAQTAEAAGKEYKAGIAAEIANDLDAADKHYITAMNMGMSFSVLEQNAKDFEQCYEVAVRVDMVDTRAGGKKLALNNPKPVAVADTTVSVDSTMFTVPDALKTSAPSTSNTPATGAQPAGPTETPAQKRKREKAEADALAGK